MERFKGKPSFIQVLVSAFILVQTTAHGYSVPATVVDSGDN
jgi:hypothetical protein